MLKTVLFSAIVAQVALAALTPAHAIYDGPKNPDPAIGDWISDLHSDYGRCCDDADALRDVYWESSPTSPSGYAIYYKGKPVDVPKGAMKVREPDPTVVGSYRPITGNRAGVALAWLYAGSYDHNGDPVYGYDDNGNPTFTVRCFIPGAAN